MHSRIDAAVTVTVTMSVMYKTRQLTDSREQQQSSILLVHNIVHTNSRWLIIIIIYFKMY